MTKNYEFNEEGGVDPNRAVEFKVRVSLIVVMVNFDCLFVDVSVHKRKLFVVWSFEGV